MKSIRGTETEKNLLKAFAGESQARTRYAFFASKARKEGYEYISSIFEETAANEYEHAEVFFKFLEGGNVAIDAAYPAGRIGTTAENLEAAAMGEYEEWADLYPEFAKVAEEEGFLAIARAFKLISRVERRHEERYKALLEELKAGKALSSDTDVDWVCRKCGNHLVGKNPPDECPICGHEKGFYQKECCGVTA